MLTAAAQYLLTYNYISKNYGGSSDAARCAAMRNGLPGGLTGRNNDPSCSSRVLLLGGRRDGCMCVYNWNTGAVDYITEVLRLFSLVVLFCVWPFLLHTVNSLSTLNFCCLLFTVQPSVLFFKFCQESDFLSRSQVDDIISFLACE